MFLRTQGTCFPFFRHFPIQWCYIASAEYDRRNPSFNITWKLYIRHETQCFITRWNTEKRVENTTRSWVFLTNFEVFHLAMKHCVECLILLLKQNKKILKKKLRMQKWAVFHLISKHATHNITFFVFSSWIINDFKKKDIWSFRSLKNSNQTV